MHLSREAIGKRLQEERKRLGFNQDEFASQLQLSKRTVAAYEAGSSDIGASVLGQTGVLGVDVLYVVTGTRTPAAADSLSDEENALVQRYRTMPPENRATVDRVAEAMAVYLPTEVRG